MNLVEKLENDHPKLFSQIEEYQDYRCHGEPDAAKKARRKTMNDFLEHLVKASKMMDRPSFDEWMKTLKQNRYKQTTNNLYDSEINAYCCLGVLCLVNGIDRRAIDGLSDFNNTFPDNLKGNLPGKSRENYFQIPFMSLNDNYQFTFPQIATIAEWARARRIRKK